MRKRKVAVTPEERIEELEKFVMFLGGIIALVEVSFLAVMLPVVISQLTR